MVDGLEEESKKSLQMEAEMERQLSEFDTERGQLHHRLNIEETKAKQLQEENDHLRFVESSACLCNSCNMVPTHPRKREEETKVPKLINF